MPQRLVGARTRLEGGRVSAGENNWPALIGAAGLRAWRRFCVGGGVRRWRCGGGHLVSHLLGHTAGLPEFAGTVTAAYEAVTAEN
ncbi:hypothetical protein [Nocardia brasiliensis]|uniref:hypothetical protein n=1 Tax=Nocardia brasiliensis TaxID=37326 RepID=UPI003D8AB4B0